MTVFNVLKRMPFMNTLSLLRNAFLALSFGAFLIPESYAAEQDDGGYESLINGVPISKEETDKEVHQRNLKAEIKQKEKEEKELEIQKKLMALPGEETVQIKILQQELLDAINASNQKE
jgi:hypothetical protein